MDILHNGDIKMKESNKGRTKQGQDLNKLRRMDHDTGTRLVETAALKESVVKRDIETLQFALQLSTLSVLMILGLVILTIIIL
jgi:hypothetical protein